MNLPNHSQHRPPCPSPRPNNAGGILNFYRPGASADNAPPGTSTAPPGTRQTDYNAWARIVSADGNSEVGAGIEYDEASNTVRLTGVIVTDATANWLDGIGVASPGMLRNAIAEASTGWTLEINSPGGDVFTAAEIVSYLQTNAPHSVLITGLAASAAAIISLAARERYAANNLAMIMFHSPWSFFMGNAVDLELAASTLRKIEQGNIDFAAKTLDEDGVNMIRAAYADGKDLFLTAQEAVDAKIITGILDDGQPEGGEGDGETAPASTLGGATPRSGLRAIDWNPAPTPADPPKNEPEPELDFNAQFTEDANERAHARTANLYRSTLNPY